MFKTKRDVDRHVEQLEAKIHSESERNLKALTVAKLYYDVREFETSKRYVLRFLEVRENSPSAHKLLGKILEELKMRENAIAAYKKAYELDNSQKDLVPKVCELLFATPQENLDKSKARYWLELGEKLYPRDKAVKNLKEAIIGNDDFQLNGNNAAGSQAAVSPQDSSPEQQTAPDVSSLWSAGGSGIVFLNGSQRGGVGTPDRYSSTPNRASAVAMSYSTTSNANSTPRRLVPRPSPERLAARVTSLENSQEKVMEMLGSQNRMLVDEFKSHSLSMLDELKIFRQATLEEMKTHRQNVMELKMEMKQGMHDLKLELSKLGLVMKEKSDPGRYHQDLKDALSALPRHLAAALPPPPPPPPPAPLVAQAAAPLPPSDGKSLSLADLQEALAQQTALLQMGLGLGMLARPPFPGGQAPAIPTATNPAAQPVWGYQAPQPPQFSNQPPQTVVQPPEISLPKAPVPQFDVAKPVPEPHRQFGQSTPATSAPAAPATSADRPHDFQISIPKSVAPVTSPFKDKEGPAVPIITTSLLSTIPSPVYSSLNKTSPATNKATTPSGTTTTSSAAVGGGNLFDKFKPKEGSWECGGCMCRNDATVIVCPSCETAKPGHEEEVKKREEQAKPRISFGAQGGFKFSMSVGEGSSSTSAKPSNPFGGFSFSGGSGGAIFGGAKTTEGATDDHLSFSGQGMKLNSAEDAKPVVDRITGVKTMKRLTLSGNTLGIEAAKAIGDSLVNHPEFCKADWKDMFTGRMKTEIPPALKFLGSGVMRANAKLVELDVSDNAFGPVGMEGLVELLKSPSCYTLQELKLNNTGCGVTGGKLLADALMKGFKASEKAGRPLALKVFVLGRSRQENDGAKALAEVFKLMGSLEEVVMPQNGIYHEGIKALTEAFVCNPNLRTLNMNDNTFTEKGAKYLANALPTLQKLTYLNLGDCLLKTAGAKVIAEAIRDGHKQLEELHMDSNDIHADGGEEIIRSVLNKPNMKKLFIGTNQFGEEGCANLMRKLGNQSFLVGGEIEDDQGSSEDEDDEDGEAYSSEEKGDGEAYSSEDKGDDCAPSSGDEHTSRKVAEVSSSKDAATNGSASTSVFKGFSFETKATEGGSSNSLLFSFTPSTGNVFDSNTSKDSQPVAASFLGKSQKPGGSTSVFSTAQDLPTFSSLATGSQGFAFGKSSNEPFSFAGAGTSLFKSPAKSPEKKVPGEEHAGEDDHHEPHFEPIIPLPELVTVTTGEEDEEVLFQHRAKIFRYDTDTKQWKERGVGDMKILKHPHNKTYRVLLRREQIHKVACNHKITTEMNLEPMVNSDNALTWFAMDYADEEPKLEKLAVRFKLEETKDEFKRIFENCQKELKDNINNPSALQGGSETKTVEAEPPVAPLTSWKNPDSTFLSSGSSFFKNATKTPEKEAGEDHAAEDEHHDPHFEPIVPLPELVQVVTGEEGEEVLFQHRAKIYRYDTDSKQWKERGVGNMKILKNPARKTFRVLLRREQIHKVACNHHISTEMKLEPMLNSDYALTWFAMDYADEEPKLEKLAVKFKLVDTKNEFKNIFEECQGQLREKGTTVQEPAQDGSGIQAIRPEAAADSQEVTEEEEEEEEETIMYERECELLEVKKDVKQPQTLGHVLLKIVYDDDVFGARIVASDGDGNSVCNHLIAMQTKLATESDGSYVWSALDFSLDPPAYRTFRVVFSQMEDANEFKDTFHEGKELADQSEILEMTGLKPQDYYYGTGADYEED